MKLFNFNTEQKEMLREIKACCLLQPIRVFTKVSRACLLAYTAIHALFAGAHTFEAFLANEFLTSAMFLYLLISVAHFVMWVFGDIHALLCDSFDAKNQEEESES